MDGEPVAGVTVRLDNELTITGVVAQPHVITDAAGRFDFGPQLVGAYGVVAEAPHLVGAVEWIDLADPSASPAPDQLRIGVHGCDASIYGTVRDSTGGVVLRPRVLRAEGDRSNGVGVDGDDHGRYELCMPTGGGGISAKADGYAQTFSHLTTYGRLHHDFVLAPEAHIEGRVVRIDDHSPVAGATVELRTAEDQRYVGATPALYAASDAEGRFHFSGLTPGDYSLTATADRLVTRSPVSTIAEIEKTPRLVTCTVTPTLEVTGRVIEQGSGKPVSGVMVYATSQVTALARQDLHAMTQSDGTFQLDGVLPGDYELWVQHYRFVIPSQRNLKVDKTDHPVVAIEVETQASVGGRVTRAGKPVDGAHVEARGTTTTSTETDVDGNYTLNDLEPGTYRIYAESKRVGAFTPGPSISIDKKEHKTGVDLELALSASISGVVVDQNDMPVSGALLTVSLLRGEDGGDATTAEDGTFTAGALSGGGDYIYEVRPSERLATPYRNLGSTRHPTIAVRDGQSRVTGVRIRIHRDLVAISGRVLDSAGTPVPDALVDALPAGSGSGTSRVVSDAKGVFTFSALPPGSYDVHATSPAGEGRIANVVGGRSDIALLVTQRGEIEGKLEGFTSVYSVTAFRAGDNGERTYYAAITNSTFSFPKLPAGAYLITAVSEDGNESANAAVQPGVTARITIRPSGYGKIEGTVSDETTHVPLSGLECDTYPISDKDPLVKTDEMGAFHLGHVHAGAVRIVCLNQTGKAIADAIAAANQITHVSMSFHANPPQAHAGLVLEQQITDIVVRSVEKHGPADLAGIAAGDVVTQLNGRDVLDSAEQVLAAIESNPPGTSIKLTIMRGEKQSTLTLKLVTASQ
jgi:protocatechuate 3,4-dioxygenase beta subunit